MKQKLKFSLKLGIWTTVIVLPLLVAANPYVISGLWFLAPLFFISAFIAGGILSALRSASSVGESINQIQGNSSQYSSKKKVKIISVTIIVIAFFWMIYFFTQIVYFDPSEEYNRNRASSVSD